MKKVALGGGCGLLIDDETVEGLSPLAIRGVILAEQNKESHEIKITIEQLREDTSHPLLLFNGVRKDIH